MPERKSDLIHVDAKAIQGEGAFLELRAYTWAERKVLKDKLATLPDYRTDPAGWNLGLMPILEQELVTHLASWNLVDGQGRPIPVGDLGSLIDGEHNFVFGKMQLLIMQSLGTDESAKN